jgi:hypothetical protein
MEDKTFTFDENQIRDYNEGRYGTLDELKETPEEMLTEKYPR